MSRLPRRELIDEPEVGIYHCVQRAVRQAFLCGQDAVTGQNFDHRKAWIQQRLEVLAGQFGIEVLSFAVMSNHCHVVLRNRPDVVQDWSDEEVARRWWFLFSAPRCQTVSPRRQACGSRNACRWRSRFRVIFSASWGQRCSKEAANPAAARMSSCGRA